MHAVTTRSYTRCTVKARPITPVKKVVAEEKTIRMFIINSLRNVAVGKLSLRVSLRKVVIHLFTARKG
jgi:N-acetylglutamate synthase/N-acetylornithine aminotransferase